jgi:hypothetical protein
VSDRGQFSTTSPVRCMRLFQPLGRPVGWRAVSGCAGKPMIDLPWELSQISGFARAEHERRRTSRLLRGGRLPSGSISPARICGILMSDRNGRDRWRAPSRGSPNSEIPRRSQRRGEYRGSPAGSVTRIKGSLTRENRSHRGAAASRSSEVEI